MLREAIIVLSVALLTTALVAAVRGLPSLAKPAAAGAACSGPVPEAPSVRWISPGDAAALLGRTTVAIVDTRDQPQYEAGHIAGAIHIPMDSGTLDGRALANLPGVVTVVAYCDASGHCARSTRFARLLSASGFRDVRVLEGGFSAWLEDGRAAESGVCRQCE